MELSRDIVLDIGGTNLRAAAYEPHSGRITREHRISTASHWSLGVAQGKEIQASLSKQIHGMIEKVGGNTTPGRIAIAFPGPIDPDGCILAAPTVWGDKNQNNYALLSELKRIWPNTELNLINDVTAAGYRYLRHDEDDLCVVTVSSGIGNKIFVKGRPIVGHYGRGGEIGHLRVDHSVDAPVCDCGLQGHLGAVASGRGVFLETKRRALSQSERFKASLVSLDAQGNHENLTNDMIVKAYRSGDPWIKEIVGLAIGHLGNVLACLHVAIGMERFVIIGGFALALGENYRIELAKSAASQCWNLGQNWDSMVVLGENDDLSGLIGAGRYLDLMETQEASSKNRPQD